VAKGKLRAWIRDPLLARAPAGHEDQTWTVTRTDEDVLRLRWAVDEVPRAKPSLLFLDQQQALARQNEEVLLVRLTVVEGARPPGWSTPSVNPISPKGGVPSPSKVQAVPSTSFVTQAASRTLTTNHPSVMGVSPLASCSRRASSAITAAPLLEWLSRQFHIEGDRRLGEARQLDVGDCARGIGAVAQSPLPRVGVLLQALSERATCAEDERLDGGLRQSEFGGDLAVREALPLA